MEDLYALLRVSPNVGRSMIVDAYNSLQKKTMDPELLSGINNAFSILGDPEKRAAYDEQLMRAEAVTQEVARLAKKAKEDQERKEQEQLEEGRKKQQALLEEQEIEQARERRAQLTALKERSSLSMQDVLLPYVGGKVGINLSDPTKLQLCTLLDAQAEFFSVKQHESPITRIPYRHLLRMVEPQNGGNVTTGIFGIEAPLFLEIFHLVVYKDKGGFMFGVMGPIGDH